MHQKEIEPNMNGLDEHSLFRFERRLLKSMLHFQTKSPKDFVKDISSVFTNFTGIYGVTFIIKKSDNTQEPFIYTTFQTDLRAALKKSKLLHSILEKENQLQIIPLARYTKDFPYFKDEIQSAHLLTYSIKSGKVKFVCIIHSKFNKEALHTLSNLLLSLLPEFKIAIQKLDFDALEILEKAKEAAFPAVDKFFPEMIIIHDKNGIIQYVNEASNIFSGYSPEELIGKSVFEFIPKKERVKAGHGSERRLQGENNSFYYESKLFKADGTIEPVKVILIPLKGENTFKRIVLIADNALEKRLAPLQSVNRLNQILRTIRSINQLIAREKDEKQLLQKCCRLLAKNEDVKFTWIVRLNAVGNIEQIYSENFDQRSLNDKFLKEWIREAIKTNQKIIKLSKFENNDEAVKFKLKNLDLEHIVFVPLRYHNKMEGILCIGLLNEAPEIEVLFKELASDLAFGIHVLELERENRKIEQSIKLINKKVKGENSQKVLESLITYIAQILNANFVFVGERMFDEKNEKIKTIAVYQDDKINKNFEFILSGTPCAYVLKNGVYACEEGVTEKFSINYLKNIKGIQGYMGIALRGLSGKAIGVFVALTKEKIGDIKLTESIFQVFAHRASVELIHLRTEQDLQKRELRYRTIFENSPFGIYRTKADGQILIANSALVTMLGYQSVEELKQKNIEKQIYANSEQRKEFIQRLRNSEGFVVFESVWKKKNGTRLYVRQKAKATKDNNGNVLYLDGTVEDITERKEQEEYICYQNKLLENAQDAIIGTDGHYRIKYWNKSAEKLYGWKTEEVLGKKIDQVIRMEMPFEKRLKIRKISKEKGFWRGEVIQFDRNGEKLYIEMAISDMCDETGKVIASVGINRDISEKLRYEEALKASEESYRGLFNSVMEAIYVQARDGTFLDVNEGAVKMYQYPKDYLIGKSPADVSAPGKNNLQKVMEQFNKALQGEPQQFEFWGKRSNGEIFPKNVRLYKGKYFGQDVVIALAEDITEKKKVQEKLIELTNAIEQSPVSVVITDTQGNIEYVNPKFSQVSGYSFDEVVGQNPRILKSGKVSDKVYKNLWNTITSGKIWYGEFINKKKDGSFFWEEATISPIIDSNGSVKHYLGFKEDITERKKLEEEKIILEKQLHQNQRLETIGTLAGGIAHDFNNILTPILGYAEMIKMALQKDAKLRNKAEQIIKASLRARDLIQQILTFSRQIDHQAKPVFLQNIVNEATHLIRASIPSTIKLRKDIEKSCPPVLADPAQLHQVLMNLCTNAFQAMEKTGGELRISLKKVQVTETTSKTHPNLKAGFYNCLTVADTGIGMEPWVQDRIFEPFFTTKGVGKGTGLGLSVVHGIVKNYKGEITVQSNKNVGTIFSIYLPAADFQDIEEVKRQEKIPPGDEYILLVDDEPSVLNLEQQMLEYFGYHTKGLTDSTKVLPILKANPGKYRLLITDLTMPNLTGMQLAELVRVHFPNLPIVMVTGYSEELTDDLKEKFGIRAILMKPVIALDLAKIIRRILDKHPLK